jgi:hypothetical protein
VLPVFAPARDIRALRAGWRTKLENHQSSSWPQCPQDAGVHRLWIGEVVIHVPQEDPVTAPLWKTRIVVAARDDSHVLKTRIVDLRTDGIPTLLTQLVAEHAAGASDGLRNPKRQRTISRADLRNDTARVNVEGLDDALGVGRQLLGRLVRAWSRCD